MTRMLSSMHRRGIGHLLSLSIPRSCRHCCFGEKIQQQPENGWQIPDLHDPCLLPSDLYLSAQSSLLPVECSLRLHLHIPVSHPLLLVIGFYRSAHLAQTQLPQFSFPWPDWSTSLGSVPHRNAFQSIQAEPTDGGSRGSAQRRYVSSQQYQLPSPSISLPVVTIPRPRLHCRNHSLRCTGDIRGYRCCFFDPGNRLVLLSGQLWYF